MCKPGTYSAAGASSCSLTSAGYYTAAGASAQEDKCPWGFYCYNDGSNIWREIPAPVYSTGVSGKGGYYLPSITYTSTSVTGTMTACDAGYYCPFGDLKRYPCPAGHYCPASSALPTPCPAKYFNINIMMTSLTDCTANQCPSGYFCNLGTKYPQPCSGTCDTALMTSSTPVTCADGTYAGNDSPSSAANCNSCWPGHYCPAALVSEHTFPILCPKGTYTSSTSASSLSDCTACAAGVVCPYYGDRTGVTGLVC
jgi:hypothetical protein